MPTVHVVAQGECFTRIARKYGFPDYKVLYNHPDNAALKKKRPNPNVLFPGDEIAIPDLAAKRFDAASDASHKFKVKLPKKMLRVVFKGSDGEPLASEDYQLVVGETKKGGKTDGSGLLKEAVSMAAPEATVTIAGRVLTLSLGHLNPIGKPTDADGGDGWSGVQGRLRNLGYDVGPLDGLYGPRTRAALAMFQSENGIEVTGKADDATLSKLKDVYGC